MPKTKLQKQQEAIERKRNFLHVYRKRFQVVLTERETNVKRFGVEEAERRLREAEEAFKRACKEAHVDTHGNPI